jgi:general secretion pathway protein A
MYLQFYGLTDSPFNPTPDPRFLYLTPQHREALSQLIYGIEARRGFMVLIGEVGTGKTTLLQALIQRLHHKAVVALIAHSTIAFDGILDYLFEACGLDTTATSRAQRLSALHQFLIQKHHAGQTVVLIIDEAQNLDPLTLEEVRLLSNFETPNAKLLQILLVGQPELQATLERPELRQLQHRIGLHCRLRALTPQETHAYIAHRLHIAGAHDSTRLTARAVKRIAAFAAGNPRLINLVCDHCLLIGYADQQRTLDREIAEQAIQYLEAGRSSRRRAPGGGRRGRLTPLRGAAVATAVALLGGAAFQALHPDLPAKVMHFVSGQLIPVLGSGRDVLLTFLRGL